MEEIKKFLFDPTVSKFVAIFLGVAIIWVIIKAVQRNFLTRIKDADNRYRAKKLSGFIGFLLTVVLLSIVFSDKLGGLTVALGVAGAGIAFALQEVITSFAGWLAIMFGGFYKVGDRVQLGGIKGDVMDIGVLRTTIMETGEWVDGDLYNGRIVLIANSFVFKEPVFNYSGDFPFLWDEIKLPVQFGSNYQKANDLLMQAGREIAGELSQQSSETWKELQIKFLLEDAQTSPMVSMTVNENWVEYTLRYVVNYRKRRATKTALFSWLLQEIEKTGSEVKIPTSTIQLAQAPDFNVNIKK